MDELEKWVDDYLAKIFSPIKNEIQAEKTDIERTRQFIRHLSALADCNSIA